LPEPKPPLTVTARPKAAPKPGSPRAPARRIAGFALLCGPVFLVLVALGAWQIDRLAWKERILASIAAAERAAPVPLPASPSPFEKVFVTGAVVPGSAALFAQDVREVGAATVEGGDLVAILRPAQGQPLLVDLGWMPDGALAKADLPSSLTVTGFAQAPQRANSFTPKDDVAGRRLYLLDPRRVGAELGQPGLAPFVLMAMGAPPARGWPQPLTSLPRPPNDHLQYALTWFGLAGVLLIQFGYWTYKVLRP
jgi:surfeit locus 1 family protein